MEGEREAETHVHEFGKLEEIFKDTDGIFFDTIHSLGVVHELNNKLKTLKEQGIDLHGVHRS